MKKENFINLINLMNEEMNLVDSLDDLGINIIESKLFTIPGTMFDEAMESCFTEEGQDLISWWVFENVPDKYIIDEDEHIDLNSIDDFWDYLVRCGHVI